ncbi:MAG: EAL domain-containing protein [Clostridiales bacterium]|nr:EAL domain-containing protein [Clostridiales bacterium]
MRLAWSVLFSILVVAMLMCIISAKRSKKSIGNTTSFLLAALSLPVLGNLVIIASTNDLISTIGYYVYFLGMDAAVYALWYFAHVYCDMGKPKRGFQIVIGILFGADVIHYILNPFLKMSFSTFTAVVDDEPYLRLIPKMFQTYHRIICYGLFLVVLIIFLVKAVKSIKVYAEKYWVMLFSMFVTGAIETYYIFSRRPIDMSMIGFGVFGLLVYFFTMRYKPVNLLDQMLASLASDMPDSLFFFDRSGKCIWINEPGKKLIGIANDNYDDVKENLKFLFGDINFDSSGWFKRVTFGDGDDKQYTYLAMRSVADDNGKLHGTYLSVRDITEEQQEMKRAMYSSTHDSLTGFYTKEHLYANIHERLEKDKETDYMVGYIDIANYRVINDVFGKKFAEFTIKSIAEFIEDNISNKKVLYGRLSDDAFGVLIDKESFDEEGIVAQLRDFSVKDDNLEHHILIHFGIYDITPEDAIDVPVFFDSARLATTMIKDNYQDLIIYYDDKLREEIIHNQLISNQVMGAIETRQIRPYLQPIVDSKGMLAGAEALVRWIHPEEGFMNPGAFIPLFERNGLISYVDKHMWRCACEILADWKERGIESFISVNISPKDFYYMDVVSELKSLVEEHGVDPVKLRVEITETAITNNPQSMFDIVSDLRNYGFIVEMDDFGSGYSSLNLLKDMSFDVVKIDMQFLKDSERNMKAGIIINNIIRMSEDLELDTLTEGVETAKQYEMLYSMGCKLYQGYYFSKPVSVEDFEKQWF